MKQHKDIFPFSRKDQIAKARSLGIKYMYSVSLLDINFDSFPLEICTVITVDIVPMCCYEKDL